MKLYSIFLLLLLTIIADAQPRRWPKPLPHTEGLPSVTFTRTSAPSFPVGADSNSPLFWDQGILYLFNSTGHPTRSFGIDINNLSNSERVIYNNEINGGRWMEAIVRADDGTVYGFYHNEPHLFQCPGKTVPRIGAAKSEDNGLHWRDLGIILEAPTGQTVCDSENHYFMGGHGDFSVMLDPEKTYLYIFYSNYSGLAPEELDDKSAAVDQGVSVARMAWEHRDEPIGKVYKYYYGTWDREPGLGGLAEPIFPTRISWHKSNSDSYWGPSIHWNTYLNQYVMLLNHAIDSSPHWKQKEIAITFSTRLDDPKSWSLPYKIIEGGGWYPQVVGEKSIQGTDKLPGQNATFYVSGKPYGNITFFRPGNLGYCPPEGRPRFFNYGL